jgi:hypothetical protein
MKTAKELRAGEEAAYMAAYRLRREIERSYKKDPDGYQYTIGLIDIISKFLDDIDAPLAKGSDIDAAFSLSGVNNAKPWTLRERGYYLIKLADEREGVTTALPFLERRKQA